MKKLLYFLPVLVIVLFAFLSFHLFSSGAVSPITIIIIAAVGFILLAVLKPKSKSVKPVGEVEKKIRGEFAKDAFANDPKLGVMFQTAINDYCNNMPKAALNKLTKLASQCTGEKELYAVSMATAQCHLITGKSLPAVREYTKALGIHASPEVAMELGSCHQRLGNLDKAWDSYEFALDLDPDCLEAASRIATTYVADYDYETALEYANQVLDKQENHTSALATAAICHGLLNDPVMCKYYTKLAAENGYSQKKIEETISALKKRNK